jgi:hypothetical protein
LVHAKKTTKRRIGSFGLLSASERAACTAVGACWQLLKTGRVGAITPQALLVRSAMRPLRRFSSPNIG